MPRVDRILFVVENDHFPHDMRVYNECKALSRVAECLVLAPKGRGQKFREQVEDIRCYRYPAIEAASLRGVILEYLIAWIWIATLIPVIALVKRIDVVHVANPPDFIIPTVAWLRLFGVRLVFDVHDLSSETLRGKVEKENRIMLHVLPALERLEALSVRFAHLVVATNESVLNRVLRAAPNRASVVVRNSNPIVYRDVSEVPKRQRSDIMHIGFFGLLANDAAAGLNNIVRISQTLTARRTPHRFSIVGGGPGVPDLKQLVLEAGLADLFSFVGFVPMPQAYAIISSFDFGLVSWGDIPKNNVHTAMKVMDYMCCGVPVCSLALTEQIRSTGGVGVHAATFEQIADKMIDVFRDPSRYEELRRQTLKRFNETLCWELQEEKILGAYRLLLGGRRNCVGQSSERPN